MIGATISISNPSLSLYYPFLALSIKTPLQLGYDVEASYLSSINGHTTIGIRRLYSEYTHADRQINENSQRVPNAIY